jgi:hypothetical protein
VKTYLVITIPDDHGTALDEDEVKKAIEDLAVTVSKVSVYREGES